jgi:hypothetical protein
MTEGVVGVGAVLTLTGIATTVISSSLSTVNLGGWGWFLIILGVVVILGGLRSL